MKTFGEDDQLFEGGLRSAVDGSLLKRQRREWTVYYSIFIMRIDIIN